MFDGDIRTAAGRLEIFAQRERAKERRRQVGNILALAGMALCVGAIPGLLMVQGVLTERAEKRAWAVEGPVCPVVAAPSQLAVSHNGRPPMTHRYGGASFTRSFGAVSCAGFRDVVWPMRERVYHVCQFNNPGAVTVRTPLETRVFEGPPGRRLTVTVREGRAQCVIGGWFSLR